MGKIVNRRDFLKTTAASGAAVAVAGCESDPVESLIPILVPPHDYVPGVSIHYATVCRECSSGCGLVVRTREGRAIKAEGNPAHPLNQGGICARGQASLQGLYSPARVPSPRVLRDGAATAIDWSEGYKTLGAKLRELQEKSDKQILYIGRPETATFSEFLSAWLEGFGGGTTLAFDLSPVHALRKANEISFGKKEVPHYHFDQTKILVSFGADFLESWLNPVQLTKGYAKMHSFRNGGKGKFIHVASHMTLTGTNADEWVSCRNGCESLVALAMTKILLESADHLSAAEKQRLRDFLSEISTNMAARRTGISVGKLESLAKEFKQNGRSLAIAGGSGTAGPEATRLQIAVNLLNTVAGNIDSTVVFGADYQIGGDDVAAVEAAIQGMRDGLYELVIVENVNPAFTLPSDSGFQEALHNVPLVVSFSTEEDETSVLAGLHLPVAHSLESWGDSRPRSGVNGLQQPVMARLPLFSTRERGDLMLRLAQNAGLAGFDFPNYRDFLKNHWRQIHKKAENDLSFAEFWKQSLKNGGHFSGFEPVAATLDQEVFSVEPFFPQDSDDGFTLLAVNSNLHDANANGGNKYWLLETPHPITQAAWDSWVEIHPDAATKLGIRHGDLVEVSSPFGMVRVAAWLYYGIDKNTIAMPAGLGRNVLFPGYKTSRGRSKLLPVFESKNDLKLKKTKVGVNVMDLMSFRKDSLASDPVFSVAGVKIKTTGKKADLVTVDGQYRADIESKSVFPGTGFGDRSQKDRGLVRTVDLHGRNGLPHAAEHAHHLKKRHYTVERSDKTSFYDPIVKNVRDHGRLAGKDTPKYHDPYKWEMIVDLDRCTGCSSCVVACYAENNIPVVGKDRMAMGREMSWLRIERFFEQNIRTGQLETYYTPQMCPQCDNAGCEPVCPVYATYQTPEGLNAMIYNRCVGTRYCSNNCAYKQRRFNWRSYEFPSPLHMQLNPAVTVRDKGVMEKCTFCQQRIREMKDIAKDKGRDVRDGEVLTACQQACPTDAIAFGNVKDESSGIYRRKSRTKRGYIQLEELNFQPAVTYMKKVNHNNSKA